MWLLKKKTVTSWFFEKENRYKLIKGSGRGRNASPISRDVTSETEAKRLVEHHPRSVNTIKWPLRSTHHKEAESNKIEHQRKIHQIFAWDARCKTIICIYSCILLCIQKKILRVSVRLPQRNLNVEASKIASKAVAVRANHMQQKISWDDWIRHTCGAFWRSWRFMFNSRRRDRTRYWIERRVTKWGWCSASQVQLSQMRRSSPRKPKIAKIVVAKTLATSSKKNKKNHAGSDDDDIPLVPKKKAYKTPKSP